MPSPAAVVAVVAKPSAQAAPAHVVVAGSAAALGLAGGGDASAAAAAAAAAAKMVEQRVTSALPAGAAGEAAVVAAAGAAVAQARAAVARGVPRYGRPAVVSAPCVLDASGVVLVHVVVLASGASRHVHPARPDQLLAGVRAALSGGGGMGAAKKAEEDAAAPPAEPRGAVCVLVGERPGDAAAFAPAVARAFPLFHTSHAGHRAADRAPNGAADTASTCVAKLDAATAPRVELVFELADVATAGGADGTSAAAAAASAGGGSAMSMSVTPVSGEAQLAALQGVVDGVREAGAAVDAPCSEMRTTHMVARARAVAEALSANERVTAAGARVRCAVLQDTALIERGFGGIHGVGRCASDFPPALVVLSYAPKDAVDAADVPAKAMTYDQDATADGDVPKAAEASFVMIGKGIVYDTGGLSLKTKEGMPGMKGDMGGSAAVLHAFRALIESAETLPNAPVHAILCLAENAIGHTAQKPDDVAYMYSGRTVEINNTDAEGRLVLADGVAFATKHLNPSFMVDIATLTGAQGIATGANHAAILCSTDAGEMETMAAAAHTGDLCYPIVFAPEFLIPEFNSPVADMKNSVRSRTNAQSSCAGLFIREHFCNDWDGHWVHVDCAYPAVHGERGTGFGVALLTRLASQVTAKATKAKSD